MLSDHPAELLSAAIAAPLCAFLAILAIKYWQNALFSVFVLLVFEGALRKWAFPWAQAQIYLVKDVILLAVYLGFLLDSRIKSLPSPRGVGLIKIVLVVTFVLGCIEVLNPYSPSVLVGLMGLKTYFLYAPVAFILPYAIKSREHLLVLIRRYLIMAIPVSVLGFIQILAGPESSLNTYVSHSEDAAALVHFGLEYDLVRTSGTFSYISGYTAFLTFVAFLAIGYNMAHGWRVKNNIAPLLALTVVVGAMFTTGSRAPVYTLVATGPVILGLAVIGRVLPSLTAMRLFILLPVLAIAALNLSPRAVQGFLERVDSSSDSTAIRLLMPFDETIDVLSVGPALGMGIGATHPSALTIMGVDLPWWLNGITPEGEMSRVTLELGVLGLLLFYSLRFLIVVFALRCVMSFKDPAYRALGIVLIVNLALGIVGQVMLNATAGLYYWVSLGLVLVMRRLEQSAGMEFGTVLVRGAEQTPMLQSVMPTGGAARRRPS
jgi:hypothetical protein